MDLGNVFGFPVVVSDRVPPGTALVGYLDREGGVRVEFTPDRCECCREEYPPSELTHGPAPYAEACGDDTSVWLCRDCLEQSTQDV